MIRFCYMGTRQLIWYLILIQHDVHGKQVLNCYRQRWRNAKENDHNKKAHMSQWHVVCLLHSSSFAMEHLASHFA